MKDTAVEALAVASFGVLGIAADDVGLVGWPDSPQPTHNTTRTGPLAASGACIRELLAVRVSVAHRRFSGTFYRLALTDRVTPDGEPVGLKAGVGCELLGWSVPRQCGPVLEEYRQRARKVVGAPLPLVEMEAAQAAELFNAGGRKRGTLPDCLIATTALVAGAALATSNSGDFRKFERAGLKLIAG